MPSLMRDRLAGARAWVQRRLPGRRPPRALGPAAGAPYRVAGEVAPLVKLAEEAAPPGPPFWKRALFGIFCGFGYGGTQFLVRRNRPDFDWSESLMLGVGYAISWIVASEIHRVWRARRAAETVEAVEAVEESAALPAPKRRVARRPRALPEGGRTINSVSSGPVRNKTGVPR